MSRTETGLVQVRASGLPWLIAGTLAFFCNASTAQNFMVRPTSLRLSARPGQTAESEIELRNTAGTGDLKLLCRAVLLAQPPNGGWTLIEPADPEAKEWKARACLDWLTLSDEAVEVAPLQSVKVKVTLRVPRGVRGTYAAAVIVQTAEPEHRAGAIGLVIRCLVPILLNVEGPIAPQRIGLAPEPSGMVHVPATEGRSATTGVWMTGVNSGETLEEASGALTILRRAGAEWRRLAEAELEGRAVLPGATIRLVHDLHRRLPSGLYRVDALLRVGGRVKARTSREVEFMGDSAVHQLAADVTLSVEPPRVVIRGLPGSRRTTTMAVSNPSNQTIAVSCKVLQPPALKGVMMGAFTGDDFTCADWLTVAPAAFELRPGAQRNVQIVADVPSSAKALPQYYALLRLQAAYPDNSSAGETDSLIAFINAKEEPVSRAQASQLDVALDSEGSLAVTAAFANTGTRDWTPTAAVSVLDPLGARVAEADMETTSGLVLPLGRANFATAIDVSKLRQGAYTVRATMAYDGEEVSTELPIRISVVDGKSQVEVLRDEQ